MFFTRYSSRYLSSEIIYFIHRIVVIVQSVWHSLSLRNNSFVLARRIAAIALLSEAILNSLVHVFDIFVSHFAEIWQTAATYSPQTFSVTTAVVAPAVAICLSSLIDHRRRQNVVRTSVTHSATPRVPLFCSYHILTSSVIYYWTDTRQHGIYLLNRMWSVMACFCLVQEKKNEISTRGTNSMPFLVFRRSSDACVAGLGSRWRWWTACLRSKFECLNWTKLRIGNDKCQISRSHWIIGCLEKYWSIWSDEQDYEITRPDVSIVDQQVRAKRLRVGIQELSVWIEEQLFQNEGLHVSVDKNPVWIVE